MYVCLYVCMSVCLYVCLSVCMDAAMHVSMYVRMFVCSYVCMYVCMYPYLSIYCMSYILFITQYIQYIYIRIVLSSSDLSSLGMCCNQRNVAQCIGLEASHSNPVKGCNSDGFS